MTDKELQQLAQTITEALADDCHLPLCMVNKMEEVKFIPKFLKLLLRTHCIVSREKVKKLCRLTVENGISIDYGLIDGLTDLVCDMFNEEYHKEMDDYDLYLKGARNED